VKVEHQRAGFRKLLGAGVNPLFDCDEWMQLGTNGTSGAATHTHQQGAAIARHTMHRSGRIGPCDADAHLPSLAALLVIAFA
jgi:hypothetical protein